MKTESAGWLDSNVILRYLLNDHADHSARARALIEAAEAGAHRLKVALHILCEVVYILESERYAREEIYGAIRDFMGIRGIEVEEEDIALEALTDYRDKGVDFSDALLAAVARKSQESVWTFKKAFRAHGWPMANPACGIDSFSAVETPFQGKGAMVTCRKTVGAPPQPAS